MIVTDVRVSKVKPEDSRVRAIVSITLDNEFAVHGIKVIEGDNNMFVSFPSRKLASGEFKDIAHPINSDTRNMIQDTILEAYNNMD